MVFTAHKRRIAEGLAAASAYVAAVYAANWLISTYGFVGVLFGLFGLVAPAGVYAAGACLTLRNVVQDRLGRVAVFTAIVAGAALSWVWSSHHLAVASGVTFLVAEMCDMAVYTPLRSRGGWARAVLSGNLVGALIDSLLFLYLAGFLTWGNFLGQVVGKYLWATIVPVVAVTGYLAVFRQITRWVARRRTVAT